MVRKKYISKHTGRRWDTKEEAIEDNKKYLTDVDYRYDIKRDKFDKQYPVKNYSIPYIPEKRITLHNAGLATGATFSENVLDSIYDNAERAGLPFKTALGLAIKESTLNNQTFDVENRAKISKGEADALKRRKAFLKQIGGKYKNLIEQRKGTKSTSGTQLINYDAYDKNPYLSAFGYANRKAKSFEEYKQMLIDGEAYADKQAKRILENTPPMSILEAGFRRYKENPKGYNPGQSNYTTLVEKRGNEAMNSPEIKSFIKRKTLSGKY